MRLAVAFQRFGPYHIARLKAAAKSGDLIGMEFAQADKTYAWDRIEGDAGFHRVVCFPVEDVADVSAGQMHRRLNELLSQVRADVVAIPGWSSPLAVAALAWCCRTHTPAILMSDSISPVTASPLKEWVKSRVVRLFSSAFVAGAPHADYVERLGIPRERIFVGFDVVDNAHFEVGAHAARQNEESLRCSLALPRHFFLTCGRFIEEKNISRLLEAYSVYVAKVGNEGWDLVLVGDGPLASSIKERIAILGISSKVHLSGFKQYHDLPTYYGLASALIQASTSDTWGLVVNEAMASGLPVLVSDRCGCASDLVEEGVNGFKFAPLDIEGLARRMHEMSGGGFDLFSMGNASKDKIGIWNLDTFAASLWSAARCACSVSPRQFSALDKALLWAIARR